MSDRGLWANIKEDSELLSKCTAKHAGRVALQLLGTTAYDTDEPEDVGKLSQMWCGELLDVTSWPSVCAQAHDAVILRCCPTLDDDAFCGRPGKDAPVMLLWTAVLTCTGEDISYVDITSLLGMTSCHAQ